MLSSVVAIVKRMGRLGVWVGSGAVGVMTAHKLQLGKHRRRIV